MLDQCEPKLNSTNANLIDIYAGRAPFCLDLVHSDFNF
jgi:hypothetical protein